MSRCLRRREIMGVRHSLHAGFASEEPESSSARLEAVGFRR